MNATDTAFGNAQLTEVSRSAQAESYPVLSARVALASQPHSGYNFLKRCLDIGLSIAILVMAAPVLLIVAVIIASSRGPIFFGQKRLGIGGAEFTCWKFRSMKPNAEAELQALMHLNMQSGPAFKMKNDPRLTSIGRFIRRTSIDELPQLWNVIRGEMSLVGPRPLPVHENRYAPGQERRLSVKPGLTCYWQISGRSNIDFDRWMELDLKYVAERTITRDISIIARTLPSVLSARGAM